MGVHKNIGIDKFPKQGAYLGRRVEVCFNYDTTETLMGRVVRDDVEEPGCMIIKLETGYYVNSTECQYSLVKG